MQYKLIANSNDIYRLNDNGSTSCIPNSEQNTDWQEYQAWLADGNTPEPAEEE